MPRARGSSPSPAARTSTQASSSDAESPWPPRNVRALVREMRANRASPHWDELRLTVLSMAVRLRGQYTDVPDEPDDIVQLVLLTFSEQDSLVQFGRPTEGLTTAQQWSRERFLAWLFQCVQNAWRMRRRQMLARPVTVDLAARELAELAGHADDLTQVEAAADGSLLAHKITQLLAVWEERSPTARAQAHCFRAYAQARLAETPLNEDELADRYNVQPGTIRVWLHRIRQRLQTQLESVEYEAAPADAQATTLDPRADQAREQRDLPLPPKAISSRDG